MPQKINPSTDGSGNKAIDASLIIINWNTRQLLLDCIKSIKEETRTVSYEIIVIDNASTDGSAEAAQEVYPDVKVIVNPDNYGFSKANNIAIKEAVGRYVCLVNSDVVALDRVVDKLVEYMDTHPEAGAIGPMIVWEDLVLRFDCRDFPTLRNTAGDYLFLRKIFKGIDSFRGRAHTNPSYYSNIKDVEVLPGCFFMVRQEALKEVGLLDEMFFFYGEDTDWCKRFWLKGWKIRYFPFARAIHYGGKSSSAAKVRFLIEKEKADLQYWVKHHKTIERSIYTLIKLTYTLVSGLGWWFIYLFRTPKIKRTETESKKEYAKQKMKGSFACFHWLLFKRKAAIKATKAILV